jgi:hypothetical protein
MARDWSPKHVLFNSAGPFVLLACNMISPGFIIGLNDNNWPFHRVFHIS